MGNSSLWSSWYRQEAAQVNGRCQRERRLKLRWKSVLQDIGILACAEPGKRFGPPLAHGAMGMVLRTGEDRRDSSNRCNAIFKGSELYDALLEMKGTQEPME